MTQLKKWSLNSRRPRLSTRSWCPLKKYMSHGGETPWSKWSKVSTSSWTRSMPWKRKKPQLFQRGMKAWMQLLKIIWCTVQISGHLRAQSCLHKKSSSLQSRSRTKSKNSGAIASMKSSIFTPVSTSSRTWSFLSLRHRSRRSTLENLPVSSVILTSSFQDKKSRKYLKKLLRTSRALASINSSSLYLWSDRNTQQPS